jgi:microcystin degradation protein MlrC
MRIALGQLWQETNTLNPLRTTRQDFEEFGVLRGTELLARMAETNELGGMIQSLRAWPEPPQLVGLVRLPAWPGGLITRDAFDWLKAELIAAVEAALPLDAVLLALHGAMAAEGHPDVEGEILATARERVGPLSPMVVTLDLHAHVTERMVRAADALVLFHTAPHIDVEQTGRRGAEVLRRIVHQGARPVTVFQRIPMVVPAERANTEASTGLSAEVKARLQKLERRPEVLAAGVATVQPWLDVPDLGTTVLVTADDNAALARGECVEIADMLWQRRREYLPQLVDVADAVRQAHDAFEGLTILSDSADATTSGAPGDSAWFLAELIRYEWARPALVALVAPHVVERARKQGAGASLDATLGGVRDTRFGCRLPLRISVERLFEARFVLSGHLAQNLPIDMGPSAVLRRGNVFVVVTSRSGPLFAPELFRTAGIDPFAAQVLVAKSPCGFRAAYESRAQQILHVRTPGCAPSDFWKYEYRNITRPLWPWDEIADWRPEPLIVRSPVP